MRTLRGLFVLLFILICCATKTCCTFTEKKMKVIHSWKSLEFAFPNNEAKSSAIRNGHFIPGAPVPIDVDVYYKDNNKLVTFVTIPRFQDGVPVTVGYVTDAVTANGDPVIAPYPNWEWNKLGTCDSITSVYRIKVDSCKRLWVLDTGKVGEHQVCPPQLLTFSLVTNDLLNRYKFPRDQYKDDSLFVTPIVDIAHEHLDGKCQDTFVYVADVTGFALIVYDLRNSRSWKITNKYFYPYPTHGTFKIKGESFELMDGILGLALSPPKPNGDRILFFHALSSVTENWVRTSVIRNYTLFEHDPGNAHEEFHIFNKGRNTQAVAQDVDKNGVLYFGLISDLAIGCWNTNNFPVYGGDKIQKLVVNSETLQFASGLKVVTPKTGSQQLWVLTSTFQKYMSGTLNPRETNFIIQAAFTDDLTRGSICGSSATLPNNGIGHFYHRDRHHHHHHLPKTDHHFYYKHHPFFHAHHWLH